MSGLSNRKRRAQRRGAGGHGALHGLGRGRHGGVGLGPAQGRFKSLERIAQPQKRQGAGGAAGLVGFGGELGVGVRANGLEQGRYASCQVVGEFEGSRRPDRGPDLLQAICAQLGGHGDVLWGGDSWDRRSP